MPRGDRTGPMGYGPMTGRGFGICNAANVSRLGLGLGLGFGYGFGRGRGFRRRMPYYPAQYPVGYPAGYAAGYPMDAKAQKEILEEQRALLKDQLEAIDQQLDGLSDND